MLPAMIVVCSTVLIAFFCVGGICDDGQCARRKATDIYDHCSGRDHSVLGRIAHSLGASFGWIESVCEMSLKKPVPKSFLHNVVSVIHFDKCMHHHKFCHTLLFLPNPAEFSTRPAGDVLPYLRAIEIIGTINIIALLFTPSH